MTAFLGYLKFIPSCQTTLTWGLTIRVSVCERRTLETFVSMSKAWENNMATACITASGRAVASRLGCEMWVMGNGSRSVGCGMWDIEYIHVCVCVMRIAYWVLCFGCCIFGIVIWVLFFGCCFFGCCMIICEGIQCHIVYFS